MSVRSLCLGRRWVPYRYLDTVDVELPGWLGRLGREAVTEAYGGGQDFSADTALVNFYDAGADAKMGLHQDKEERSGAPVVSLSLGDRCVFRFGNTENRGSRTPTWSWRPGISSSSAGRRASRTTGCPRSFPARPIRPLG